MRDSNPCARCGSTPAKRGWLITSGQAAVVTPKASNAYHAVVTVDVHRGTHMPDSKSVVVAEAARLWLESGDAAGLERSTLDSYRQHVNFHIVPLLGAMKLSQLTVPGVRQFEDRLRRDRSPVMARKVLGSLSAILADAQERGLVSQNVVRGLRARRLRGKERRADNRQKGRLRVGVDIPSPDEIRAIIAALEGRWRPLLLTAIFAGLRASELRGLRWNDVDLKRNELHIRQRADRYSKMGALKSEAGERSVPIAPMLANTLREWKLICPKGELGLVFPNGIGRIESHANIINRGLVPTQIAAGVTAAKGVAKYTGLHSLRHFYASWCINRRVDGGLELPLKVVQARLGHASVQMTADRYGHLFPSGDDGGELAEAEKAFLGWLMAALTLGASLARPNDRAQQHPIGSGQSEPARGRLDPFARLSTRTAARPCAGWPWAVGKRANGLPKKTG